jgi:hypothetical protein
MPVDGAIQQRARRVCLVQAEEQSVPVRRADGVRGEAATVPHWSATIPASATVPASAPAGRVFREWVAIPRPDRRRWHSLLAEARGHAANTADHAT